MSILSSFICCIAIVGWVLLVAFTYENFSTKDDASLITDYQPYLIVFIGIGVILGLFTWTIPTIIFIFAMNCMASYLFWSRI